MQEAAIKRLVDAIDDESPYITESIEDAVRRINNKGYLREPVAPIFHLEIQKGDRIHVVYGGPTATEEFYVAQRSGDTNGWSTPDSALTFYLVDRPDVPKIKIEDLAPGTQVTARLFGGLPEKFVRLKGNGVLAVETGVALIADNADFDVEEVHD